LERTNKYRLPTEAEWEYAARAGTTTPFYTGKCLSTKRANYNGIYPLSGCSKGNYRQIPIHVASFNPNAWGLYDMMGNVSEWVQDWYGTYPSGSVTNPTGPSWGLRRVLRGGSWHSSASVCRSAFRYDRTPGSFGGNVGFRLVRTP
jgi:formylglycine-generating enzyme required for sulfatase activity